MNRISIVLSLVLSCLLFVHTGDAQITYNSQYIVNMSNELGEFYDFQTSDKIQQSFRLNMDDVNAISATIRYLFLNTDNRSPGEDFGQLNISFYEGTIEDLGSLIYTQPYTFEFIDEEIGMVYPFEGTQIYTITGNLELEAEKDYVLEVKAPANYSRPGFGFKTTVSDIGNSNRGDRDVWMKFYGTVISNTDTSITLSNAELSNYYLDTYSNFFPSKILNRFEPDYVWVNSKRAGNLAYHSSDVSIVNVELVQQDTGVKDVIELMGLAPGKALVYLVNQNDTISHFDVSVTDQEIIRVSYQYIKYPGETDHNLLTGYSTITERIRELYHPVNVHLEYTDQGIIEYEWDLNGDGQSFSTDGNELLAAANQIPNSKDFFSNLFIIRENKDDTYYGGANGGGSSLGFGPFDTLPRYGYVSAHLFRTEESLAETLAHELGHNFGLRHYSAANMLGIEVPFDLENLMRVGRTDNLIYGFQWDEIHNTIRFRKAQGEDYDLRADAQIDDFEDTTLTPTTAAFQFTASTNSDAKIIYKLTSGHEVIDLDNDGNAQILSEGQADVIACVYATENFRAASKSITLTVSAITQVEAVEYELINIYPNPNKGVININSRLENAVIRVFDLEGRIVHYDNQVNTANYTIDLQGHSGIHFVEISSANKVWTHKLVLK